jgi:chromate transporter
MKDDNILWTLTWHFAILSLFAIGGANAAITEMHRVAVEVMGWMTDRQFADMFAIGQVTPGPNVIVVTLIGYHVAGLSGALVATFAMCGPTCLFAYFVGGLWERFREARWRIAIQAGLVPVSVGLLAASALIVARAADRTWVALVVTLATAAIAIWTKVNPVWLFAGAALLGLGGWM